MPRFRCLSRNQMRYILGPADTPETFHDLKNHELAKNGEYCTQQLVLEAQDREESGEFC